MDKLPICVLIPVKNEAGNLPRCLAALGWAGQVIVIDSASTDATASIAQSFGAQVVQFSYTPPWPKKKQWALDTLSLAHPWVLLLDADEVLPPHTPDVLRPLLTEQNPTCGYWINRRFYFLGAPLRHAYTPNWNLRLFKKGTAHFERLTTAETHSGDNEVHEHLICSGPTRQLPGLVMDHYAFPTVEVFMEKHRRYARWEAAVELFPAAQARTLPGPAALRRTLKNLSRALPFRPLLRFLWVYFFQKAFLDGARGFTFARLHATYEALIAQEKRRLRSQQSA